MNGEKFLDTGKVKIGIAYQRDTRPMLTRSEEKLQEALLAKEHSPLNSFICLHPAISAVIFITSIALLSGLFSAL